MRLQLATTALAMALVTLSTARGDSRFEETTVVTGTQWMRGWMGDFLIRKDGTLWMVYTQGGTSKDAVIVAVSSADRGKTWGQPFTLVASPGGGNYYCHPSLHRLANGDILLTYIYVVGDALPYYSHNYYRRSTDEGKTWSEQFILTPYPGCVAVHNDRLITLAGGRILGIAAYKAHHPSSDDHGGYVGMSFFSDDRGYSWQTSKNTVDMRPIEVQEADAVELKDGRIMMFARTYSGHPVRAYSSDRGETWSKGELIKELLQPYAGFPTVRRIPSTSDLLFIWCGDKSEGPVTRRTALACAISKDEGKTFLHQHDLARDANEDFGYQCVEFLGDDLVLIGYHTRDTLRVARVGIDWFYDK